MTTLIVVGAGGHGRVVADAALTMQRFSRVLFVDDGVSSGSSLGLEIVGSSGDLTRLASPAVAAVVGIGNAAVRLRLLERCRQLGFQLPVITHRSAAVSPFATLGEGTVVFAQAAINAGATLGAGCIVNTGASVDHDCRLEDAVHVCPGVRLAGDVRVGTRAWIGIGACVRQGITIGSDTVVGAGAAVVANVASGVTVVGVPARPRPDQRAR